MVFKPGESGNPGGHKKGEPNQRTQLLNAIRDMEAKEGIPFWPTVLRIAMAQANKGKSDLLRELVKKLLPDQIESHMTGEFSGFKFTES